MLKGIDSLSTLQPAEWPRVRDISIPFRYEDSSGPRANSIIADLDNATCFVGSTKARRLCSGDDSGMTFSAVGLMSKAESMILKGQERFRLEHDGLCLRAQVGRNAHAMDLQLRVLPKETPNLHELRLPPTWRSLMLDEALCEGGLILLTGPNGQGKTTTAAAMVRSRLEAFGGMANTVEDPVELPLQGVWGNGVCYQRPSAQNNGQDGPGAGYHRALMDALRQFPAISGGCTQLFVGEIQDSRTAMETLKAAANGHLVIATIHGNSAINAVRRLLTLASDRDQGLAHLHAKELLSECLRGVFNQRLIWRLEGEGWDSASVEGEVMWSNGFHSNIANFIRTRHPEHMSALVAHQTQLLNSVPADASQAEVRAAIAAVTGLDAGLEVAEDA